MKTRHYYLELVTPLDECNPYYAQTYWVDSIEKVVEQYKKIKKFVQDMFDYEQFSDDFKCDIMYADFDESDDNVDFDVERYGAIYTDINGKVVY